MLLVGRRFIAYVTLHMRAVVIVYMTRLNSLLSVNIEHTMMRN